MMALRFLSWKGGKRQPGTQSVPSRFGTKYVAHEVTLVGPSGHAGGGLGLAHDCSEASE